MKNYFKLTALSVLLLFGSCTEQNINDQITFTQVDPLSKIFRESNFLPEFNEDVEVAAGEHATFQFAIRAGLPLNDLCMEVSNFKNKEGETLNDIETGFIDYVSVSRPTPERAVDALNSLSSYYPDPIINTQHWNVKRDITQPMWITVNVPRNAKAGDYKATFTLKGKLSDQSFTLSKDINIKVYPVVLDEPDLWVTNWFSTETDNLKIINNEKDIEKYSDTYWNLVKKLADKMKVCYSNVILINPFEHIEFKETEGKWEFDFTQFDKMVTIMHDAGVLKMIEGGHIAKRCGNWDSQYETLIPIYKDGKKETILKPLNTPEAKNFYNQFLPALYSHIKSKFPEVLYAQHIADEPTDSNLKTYVEIAKYVKSLCPEIKLIEACHTHNLENVLDIWVPQLNFFKTGYNFYKERQAAGDEVWFYTCLGPQGELANRFIEQPLIKPRLLHWLNFKYNSNGYLHWGLNKWNRRKDTRDPFGETSRMNLESGNVLPGGDSWILYPKDGEVYGSMRLEAMRDGITDYTLLRMLEKKNSEQARELCRLVVYRWERYDIDTDHFRWIRHKILEELSK